MGWSLLRSSYQVPSIHFVHFLCTLDLSDDEEKLLFAVLDRDGSSRISEEEFMDFGSVLMLEFVKVSMTTLVMLHFHSLYG